MKRGLCASPLVVDKSGRADSIDGKVRTCDAATGELVWQYDPLRPSNIERPRGVHRMRIRWIQASAAECEHRVAFLDELAGYAESAG